MVSVPEDSDEIEAFERSGEQPKMTAYDKAMLRWNKSILRLKLKSGKDLNQSGLMETC